MLRIIYRSGTPECLGCGPVTCQGRAPRSATEHRGVQFKHLGYEIVSLPCPSHSCAYLQIMLAFISLFLSLAAGSARADAVTVTSTGGFGYKCPEHQTADLAYYGGCEYRTS